MPVSRVSARRVTMLAMEQKEPKPVAKFVALQKRDGERVTNIVVRGDEHICTAKSHTMAKRIANALNSYTPNERGE